MRWWHHNEMRNGPHVFSLAIAYEREEDGGWLADIPELPGVSAYGSSKRKATAAVQALALRLIADRLERDLPPKRNGPWPPCCGLGSG